MHHSSWIEVSVGRGEENPLMSLPTSTLPSFNMEHSLIEKCPLKEVLAHTEMLRMDPVSLPKEEVLIRGARENLALGLGP